MADEEIVSEIEETVAPRAKRAPTEAELAARSQRAWPEWLRALGRFVDYMSEASGFVAPIAYALGEICNGIGDTLRKIAARQRNS